MKSVSEDHGETLLIKLRGKIDIGVGDIQLRRLLDGAVEQGYKNVILDFNKISYMDSSGIGELVADYNRLTQKGIKMAISHLNSKVYDLMTITRMITVLPIFDSNEDAMMSLGQAA